MTLQRQTPEEEDDLRRKPAEEEELSRVEGCGGETSEVTPSIESRIDSLRGSGAALPDASRSFFGPRFGHDFGSVRVHSGAQAAELARAVNARAFTVGANIFFGAGQYVPASDTGRALLAHELTHVVQQGAASGPAASIAPSGPVQRAAPAAAGAAALIGKVAAKCIIGAITGVLFDAAIQAALYSWKKKTLKFWKVSLNYCSLILSAILGCIAAPISAYLLEPWITAQLGTKLGGMAGTLIGKILIFIAKKLSMAIPKGIVGKLLKLNCISKEQAAELGVTSPAMA